MFDVLLEGEPLRGTLQDSLLDKGLSTEVTVPLEYTFLALPPQLDSSVPQQAWCANLHVADHVLDSVGDCALAVKYLLKYARQNEADRGVMGSDEAYQTKICSELCMWTAFATSEPHQTPSPQPRTHVLKLQPVHMLICSITQGARAVRRARWPRLQWRV